MEGESSKLGLELVELGDGGGSGSGGDVGQGGVLYVQDGLMQGPSGEQYVTIIQDGQTYAIPASDYAAMMAQQGLEVVEPTGSDAGGVREQEQQQPPSTAPANCSNPLAESLAIPSTPLPPTIPHLTPCPPPTLAQVSNPPLVKTELQAGRSAKVGQSEAGKAAQGMKGRTNASVGTEELKGSVGPGTKHTGESGGGGGGGAGGAVGGGGGGGGGGPSMRWMTATAPPAGSRAAKQEPKRQIYPTMQQVVSGKQEAAKKNFQPIRVDNWGIFLLSRLQNYFTKKELCDLTLRFPAQNAQIKVHKLILTACTEYFSRLEQEEGGEGKEPGQIDMPSHFTPEALAPIIRFMYTGRLDLKEGTYKKMYETAQTLQMSVLTKLMDAQVNGVSVGSENRKPVKRSNGAFDDDPVEQIRKIRKIEKQVAQEERKRVVSTRTRQEELARLPGKKLPIWKRRTPEAPAEAHLRQGHPAAPVSEEEQKLLSISREAGPAGYRIPRVGEEVDEPRSVLSDQLEQQQQEDGQLIPPPLVNTTYRKRSPGEKPKIPRRLQEIQQHLMFEKILKTGTKNTVAKPAEPEEQKTGDLSLEEVKALVEEQKQRMAAASQDEEEEDYYDESVGIGDDYIDADVDSPAPPEALEETAITAGPAPEPEAQKKSVRFSLRPNPRPGLSTSEPNPVEEKPQNPEAEILPPVSNPANLAIRSDEAIDMAINVPQAATSQEEQAKQQISLTLPEPGPKVEEGIQTELDEALEEFSRVAEEEEAEEMRVEGRELGSGEEDGPRKGPGQDHTKPRRGRPPRWLKEQTMQMGELARKKEEQAGPVADQAQVINEVMKKYPNLFKDNKQVKIKVVTKDPAGRSVTKLITLKSHPSPAVAQSSKQEDLLAKDAPVPAGLASLKPVTKVMYTGKRGRPKKVKPGMHDPHQAERREIEERLMRDYPALANQINKEEDEDEEDEGEEEGEGGEEEYEEEYKYGMTQEQGAAPATSESQSMDPSSEAEALSNVASGIAASLGLVEQQYPGQVVVQDGQLVLAGGQQQQHHSGQEFLQVLGQSAHMPGMQYSLAKDPRLQHTLPMAPELGLPQGLIPVSSAMFAASSGMLPVTSDQLMGAEMVASSGNMLPMVVTSSPMLPGQPGAIMLQQTCGPQVLVPASSMMQPGIVVMSPQIVAPPPSTSAPVSLPETSKDCGPIKVVNKIASDWDSDDDQ